MKISIIFLFLSILSNAFSQDITIDKVTLTNASETNFSAEIPMAKDMSGENKHVVANINAQILDRFGISDFNKKQSEDFRWGDVSSSFMIKEEILYIEFSAEYYGGAYPNHIEDELYFNLASGKEMSLMIVPFESLFTFTGYFDFLNKYWLPGVKKEFNSAITCAGMEPLCSYYDINDYTVKENQLIISLTNECFPHVAQACSPSYSISVELDMLSDYLNDLGKAILSDSNNFSEDPIEKLIANRNILKKEALPYDIQERKFIFGKIDGKYPISMAIDIYDDGQISGYYYYDKVLQGIMLDGRLSDNNISLAETVEFEQTGYFELMFSSNYEPNGFFMYGADGESTYLVGNWRNPENTKNFDIIFTEVKSIVQEETNEGEEEIQQETAESIDVKIAFIREKFGEISRKMAEGSYTEIEFEIDSNGEFVLYKRAMDGDDIRFLSLDYCSDHGCDKSSYYFWDDLVFFEFQEDSHWVGNTDIVSEKRIYYYAEKEIRCLERESSGPGGYDKVKAQLAKKAQNILPHGKQFDREVIKKFVNLTEEGANQNPTVFYPE